MARYIGGPRNKITDKYKIYEGSFGEAEREGGGAMNMVYSCCLEGWCLPLEDVFRISI